MTAEGESLQHGANYGTKWILTEHMEKNTCPFCNGKNTGSQINYPECSNIFSANDIHNANEIGLFNCSLPEGTLV